jgi:hypothetical protein
MLLDSSFGPQTKPTAPRDVLLGTLELWLVRRIIRYNLVFVVNTTQEFIVHPDAFTDDEVKKSARFEADRIIQELERCAVMDVQTIRQLLLSSPRSLTSAGGPDAEYAIVFDLNQLKTEGATKYQQIFNDANRASKYIVSAAYANDQIPVPKYTFDGVFAFNGRSDCVSIVRPWFIEFKGGSHSEEYDCGNVELITEDWALIQQCIDRVCCTAALNSHYSVVGAFGVTCTRLWVTVFRREWIDNGAKEPSLRERVHILRSEPNNLSHLWALLTEEAVLNRDLMFVDRTDSAYLTSFLNGVSMIHGYCKSSVAGASSSNVYSMGVPGGYTAKQDKCNVGRVGDTKHVSVKIIRNRDHFERECRCVKQISEYLHQTDLDAAKKFYVAGTWQYGSCSYEPLSAQWAQFFHDVNRNAVAFLSKSLEANTIHGLTPWWLYTPAPRKCEAGGIIIMRCADVGAEPGLKMFADAQEWLRHIHDAGVLHCDLKFQNMLLFRSFETAFGEATKQYRFHTLIDSAMLNKLDDGWQIVDFGASYACEANAKARKARQPSPSPAAAYNADAPVIPFSLPLAVVSIVKDSGQYLTAGKRIRRSGASVQSGHAFEVQWSVEDDWDMFCMAVRAAHGYVEAST